MVAARDRFGIKAAVLCVAGRMCSTWLSEVKALFAAGNTGALDEESVYHSVSFGGHQMRTLFDGVFQVPPGHFLIGNGKHLQVSRYWDFDYRGPMPLRLGSRTPTTRPSSGTSWKSGADQAARGCAGWRVPERRAGFVLGAGTGGEAHAEPIRAFTLTFEDAATTKDR